MKGLEGAIGAIALQLVQLVRLGGVAMKQIYPERESKSLDCAPSDLPNKALLYSRQVKGKGCKYARDR